LKRINHLSLESIYWIQPIYATTGVTYNTGGKGPGFFQTFDDKDPLVGMFAVLICGFIVLLIVRDSLADAFYWIADRYGDLRQKARERKYSLSRKVLRKQANDPSFVTRVVKSHDFLPDGTCKLCGCTKSAVESFGWRCRGEGRETPTSIRLPLW